MATPEYYPDLHTLSRHDALPFSSRNLELSLQKTDGTIRWRANIFRNHVKNYIYGRTDGAQVNENGVIDLVTSNNEFLQRFWSQGEATIRGAEAESSEEHTSELQSLMRHSYAVICMKNKIK